MPRLYVELYEAARRGELERVRELHARVMRIATSLYTVGAFGSAYLKGLKCALACVGLCDDFMAEPFRRFGPPERERIKYHLDQLGLFSNLEGAAAVGLNPC